MSQQQQMNMAAMGGPVGGPQMNAGTPSNSGDPASQAQSVKKLNTAIYDYLLRNQQFELARQFHAKLEILPRSEGKPSPNQRGQQANGVDDSLDVDSKDNVVPNKPNDLPHGDIEPDFLRDWWCQFWEIWNGHRKPKAANPNTQNYIMAQRAAMQGRMSMVNGNGAQNMRAYNGMMPGVNNGVAMPNDLKRAAMQNQQRLTPQQQQQQQQQMMKNMQASQQNGQMMQANQMERQGSQMDNMSAQRSGSPGSGDAPSPKRQRLEGNMQTINQGRPGQPGQMQGNQVGPSPPPADESLTPDPAEEKTRELLRKHGLDPDHLAQNLIENLKTQATNVQAQAAEVYANSIKLQQTAQMNDKITNSDMNKGIPPNMGPGGAQGSPMSQPGMDAATGEFYAAANGGTRMAMQPNAAGAAAAGQAGNSNGNHALQDYQMQLMLLEQQNKKRLLMARQEQDSMSGQGHPGGVGPNGAFAQGMSPQGSQRGGDPSPNPNDMQRGRGSPTPGMMDPSQMPPAMRAQIMAQSGQMVRPPSSHPMMNAQQVEMMRAQGMQIPNGQFPGGQPPQGMPGQPGQPMGTPRQNNMPPPPAPQANAGGTQPSSPAQPAAPPTPSQTAKPKPGTKKEAAKKGAAQKKGAANATPATESEAPPTPTPATPITPMNANSFNKNQNLPNGQPPTAAQANNQQQNQQGSQPQPVAQPTAPTNPADMGGPFGALDGSDQSFGMPLEFSNLNSDDVLDNFDFDSFLNQDGDMSLGFDASFNFGDGIEAGGLDGTNG